VASVVAAIGAACAGNGAAAATSATAAIKILRVSTFTHSSTADFGVSCQEAIIVAVVSPRIQHLRFAQN
jgi:hypothetical protein